MAKCFVFVDDEVKANLLAEGLDLSTLVQQALEAVDSDALPVDHQSDPAKPQDGTRGLELVIVASAAVIAAFGIALSQIIRAVGTTRSAVVTDEELVPVCDKNGELQLDGSGSPVLVWRKTAKIVQAKEGTADSGLSVEVLGLRVTQTSKSGSSGSSS